MSRKGRKRARKGNDLSPAEQASRLNLNASRYFSSAKPLQLINEPSIIELSALFHEVTVLIERGASADTMPWLLQLYQACDNELTAQLDSEHIEAALQIAKRLSDAKPDNVNFLEVRADLAVDLADAYASTDPVKADRLYVTAIQLTANCYSESSEDKRALYAESYVTVVEQYMRFRLAAQVRRYHSLLPSDSLMKILSQAFSFYPPLLKSPKARKQSWLAVMQQDFQALCQMAIRLTLANKKALSDEHLLALIEPSQRILSRLQSASIHQYDLSAKYKDRLAALSKLEVAASPAPVYMALPTEAMIAAPSHGFMGSSRLQLSGDGAHRVAWMCEGVIRAFADEALQAQTQVASAAAVTAEQARALLQNVYAAEELEHLQAACSLSERTGFFYALDASDTFVNWASYQAVMDCMKNIHALTEAVLATPASQTTSAFAVQRPPNHHAGACRLNSAEPEQQPGTGFCIANAMLAEAIERVKAGIKVLIVDIDVHSGNGTQKLLIQTVRRLTFSRKASDRATAKLLRDNIRFVNSFEKSNYPFNATSYEASHDHASCAEYADMVCNMPYEDGVCGADVVKAVKENVAELEAAGFTPDITFCSYGMDAYKDDALSKAKFEHADYRALLKFLPAKLVVLPEGGYHKRGLQGAMQVAAEVCAQRSRAHLKVTAKVSSGTRMAGSALVGHQRLVGGGSSRSARKPVADSKKGAAQALKPQGKRL